MSQLAFDEDGEPIDLPPTATGWRVRRMKGTRGAPGLVYSSDGAPLVIPLEMDIDDLRREVRIPGRYKLDPVDDRRRLLEAKAAVVVVPPGEPDAEESAEPTPAAPSSAPVPESPSAIAAVMEAMRQTSDMARTIVDRFPAMLESSAVLLKAADGAGLPAREPRREERDGDDDDQDDEDDEDGGGGSRGAPGPAPTPAPVPPSGFDLNALVAQVASTLVTAWCNGELKLPSLAEILDWRTVGRNKRAQAAAEAQAASEATSRTAEPAAASEPSAKAKTTAKTTTKAAPAEKAQTAAEPAATEAPADAATDAELPPLSPQAMAHFLAIQTALTPEEAALARAAAAELSPRDVRAWFDELFSMTVPEAVARVRALLAATSKPEAA